MTASKRIATFVAALFLALPLLSAEGEKPRFHHVHLNVVDPERTMGYYVKVHGAVPTRYAGVVDALFMASPASSSSKTGVSLFVGPTRGFC